MRSHRQASIAAVLTATVTAFAFAICGALAITANSAAVDARAVGASPTVAKACVPANAPGARSQSKTERSFRSNCKQWLGWFHQRPPQSPGGQPYKPYKRIGAVSYSKILRQVDSNLKVLDRALHGRIRKSAVIRVPLGNRKHYALAIWLDLSSAGVLRGHPGHLADIQDGLETGLTGSPNTLIEGESIEAYAGREPLLGAWVTYHNGVTGSLEFSAALGNVPCEYFETMRFPNLTGGPGSGKTGTALGGTCGEGPPKPARR